MAFPTNETRRSLASALDRAQAQASSIKRIAANNRDRMAAGPITAGGVFSLLDNLIGAKAVLSEAASMQGIAEYAQAQLGQDISGDFAAMMNAIDTATAWIINAIPKAGGYIQTEAINADGSRTERTFTTAQTAGLRAALDTIIATID